MASARQSSSIASTVAQATTQTPASRANRCWRAENQEHMQRREKYAKSLNSRTKSIAQLTCDVYVDQRNFG